jgi:hypothetical protein
VFDDGDTSMFIFTDNFLFGICMIQEAYFKQILFVVVGGLMIKIQGWLVIYLCELTTAFFPDRSAY